MQGLMLHCGANAVTRDQLAAMPVPKPRGPRHAVRPFIDDVELVRDELQSLQLMINDEAYGVLYDKEEQPARFFGLLQIGDIGNSDFSLTVGLRGAYDQSMRRALAVGSRVFVCDNLAFSGEITVGTKQTTNIGMRIPRMLRSAVQRVPDMAHRQGTQFDAYRNTTISQERGDAALIELVRRKALNPSQLGKAIQEWDEPSHEEHAEAGRTIWRLHNAVTEAIKPSNEERATVPVAWERTRPMTGLFNDMAGVA